jgi:hypothetical protein
MTLRGIPFLAAVAVVGPVAAVPASAQGAGDEVRSTVVALFDALRAKDEAGRRAVGLPETRIIGIRAVEDHTSLRATRFEDFIRSVVESEAQLDEQNWEVEVSVRGKLANVWQRYNMYIDGALHHCGTEAIHLFRSPEGWKIIQISETFTEEGCDPRAERR